MNALKFFINIHTGNVIYILYGSSILPATITGVERAVNIIEGVEDRRYLESIRVSFSAIDANGVTQLLTAFGSRSYTLLNESDSVQEIPDYDFGDFQYKVGKTREDVIVQL